MDFKTEKLFKALDARIVKTQASKSAEIASFYIDTINSGTLQKGEKLPSINETAHSCNIACETVRRAYAELKAKGLLTARQGKAFFVAKSAYREKPNVFLMFDSVHNPYKSLIYRGILDGVGNRATLYFCAHGRNENLFKTLLKNALGKYEYYVVIPMRDKAPVEALRKLNQKKLMLLDIDVDFKAKACSKIVQNFDANLMRALDGLKLEKYEGWDFRFVNARKNGHPSEIGPTLEAFCTKRRLNFLKCGEVLEGDIRRNTVWFVIEDSDLVKLMKASKRKGLKLKRDYSVLTYNDTDMKHIIEGGVSTVSIDFYEMGLKTAKQILKWDPALSEVMETRLIPGNTI